MVLLHALGESRHARPGIAERLAQDFQVFAVDLRGQVPACHYVHREKRELFLEVLLGWLARYRR
jgi:hypothetical protein